MWLAIAAGVVVTVGGIGNHFALDDAIPDLDAGDEGSLNNWLSVVLSFGAGLAAILHAVILPRRRLPFAVAGAIFVFLSLDDLLTLHERVATNIDIEHIETAIFAPVYGLGLIVAWGLARDVPARSGRMLRAGLVLLVAAIVVDFGASFTADLRDEGTEWPHFTRIAIEEGLEVSGWTLVSTALVVALCLALLPSGSAARSSPAAAGR
jgi:hypothetical protein